MNHILWWIEDDSRDRMLRRGSFILLLIYPLFAWTIPLLPEHTRLVYSYALWIFLGVSQLGAMTCELSELKRAEALMVTPGFVRNLRLGALQCIGFMTFFGALSSAVMRDWLPLLSTLYAGLAYVCLQLPDWVNVRQEESKPVSLKSLARGGVSWSFLLALILPAVCLVWLPKPFVLVGLGLACLAGLALLPARWPGPVGRAARTLQGNVLLQPSLEVILTVIFLLLCPMFFGWKSGAFNPVFLLMTLPATGLGAIARESVTLRALLGQWWLLGKDRDELWRIGMWRLFVAIFPEYVLYLACILFGYAQGWIGTVLPLLMVYFLSYAALVWLKGMREVVLGTSSEIISGIPLGAWLLFPSMVLIGFVSIWLAKRSVVDIWLIALLCVLPVVVWIVVCLRRDFRRFQTAELW